MAIDLSQGILPGLQVADQLRNSRVARESTAQADMIALANHEREQALQQAETEAFQSLGSVMSGDGLNKNSSGLVDETDWGTALTQLGGRIAKAGFGKRGQELIEAGVDYRKRVADIEKTGIDTDVKRLEMMNDTADWVARNLGASESEFNVFKSMLKDPRNSHIRENLGEDNVAILETMDWSPELVNFFRDKAISIKDQATLSLTERQHRRLEQSARDTEDYRAALIRINEGNLEERRLERERKEKSTGTDVGKAATSGEVATAKSVILNTVKALEGVPIEGEIETAFNHMAENVAGRAKVIVAENRGTTYPEAVEQAVMEAEAAGDFAIIETVKPGWLWDTKTETRKYERRGATKAKPMELPDGDPADVAGKLVKGRFYNTPMGVLKWNGSSFDQ